MWGGLGNLLVVGRACVCARFSSMGVASVERQAEGVGKSEQGGRAEGNSNPDLDKY